MEFCRKNPALQRSALQRLRLFVLEWRTGWETSPPDFERFEHELRERIMTWNVNC